MGQQLSQVKRILLCFLAGLALWPISLPAQVGAAPAPDGHLLPLQCDTFAIYYVWDGDTVRTGTVVDVLRSDGERLIRVFDQADHALGPEFDSVISRVEDLAPIAYHGASDDRIAHLQFGASSIIGWLRRENGDSVSLDLIRPAVVYDGFSYDLVVRASALRNGYRLTVPVFLLGPNSIVPVTGGVTGSELVNGHDCWVFAADFAGMPVTFWIDKKTRALRRQFLRYRSHGGALFVTPAEPREVGHPA
jgi:hypothetical protein